ncbi:MAG TPA: AraC family transcriptional regulator [Anaerolineales bacterium]|nr:AraC family transcriptional regulator [Anaerolineales bacterium]
MDLICEERPSDSPFVETIWRSHSEGSDPFVSMADGRSAMVIAKHQGRTSVTVRGPETKATLADGLAGVELFGIRFKPGTFLPNLPATLVMDRRDLDLPQAGSRSFWLSGSAWQIPSFENADTFVERLVHDGLLVHDSAVSAMLRGEPVDLSVRTAQRRFLRATGLTRNTLYQIERARYATVLLKQGASILDTVAQAGYFDQPHLTRSLKHFIGLTPAQISHPGRTESLSFLYKTASFEPATIQAFS